MKPGDFRYCPLCGAPLQPFHDGERLRKRCPRCGWIHYRNPTVGVAVALIQNGTILLGQRREGGWCIPCGHVEWDETVEEAARREFLEETGLQVTLSEVLAVQSNFHDPAHHTVGIWYRGKATGGDLRPGGDLVEVRFFPFHAPPPLKFSTDTHVIRLLQSLLHEQR